MLRAKTGKQVTVEVRSFFLLAVHVLHCVDDVTSLAHIKIYLLQRATKAIQSPSHPSFISRALHSLELARVHASCFRSHQDSQHALEDSLDPGRRYGKLLFLRMSSSRSPGILLLILLSSIQQPCRYAREIHL